MLTNLLLPFDQHFDDGFHAVGHAFKESADRLATSGEENFTYSNSHLPVNYLYRHSIELFLKSAILTIHRALQLPNGDGTESKYPPVKDGPKWRLFKNTHCVTLLLNEVDRLVSGNEPAFASKDADHWSIPDELRILIQVIEKYDKSSTFSRYGDSGNQHDEFKADFVRVDPAKLNVPDVSSSGGLTYILLNDENVAAQAFELQTDPLPEFRLALVKAAEMLSSASFELDADLVRGRSTLAKAIASNTITASPNESG